MRDYWAALNALLTAHPAFQSFLAWVGVTILWETVIKGARARRGLAFMLAEEVGLNLSTAVAYQVQSELTPNAIPSDLHLSDVAFGALSSQLSQLPKDLIGDAILYYGRVRVVNALAGEWAPILERYNEMRRDKSRFTEREIALHQITIDSMVNTYKQSLVVVIGHSDVFVRKLRVAATLGGRYGYFFVRKTYVSPSEVRERVNEHRKAVAEHGSPRPAPDRTS